MGFQLSFLTRLRDFAAGMSTAHTPTVVDPAKIALTPVPDPRQPYAGCGAFAQHIPPEPEQLGGPPPRL